MRLLPIAQTSVTIFIFANYLVFGERHLEEFTTYKFSCDDATHEGKGAHTADEEDTFYVMKNAKVLRHINEVQDDVVQPGSREVFPLEIF